MVLLRALWRSRDKRAVSPPVTMSKRSLAFGVALLLQVALIAEPGAARLSPTGSAQPQRTRFESRTAGSSVSTQRGGWVETEQGARLATLGGASAPGATSFRADWTWPRSRARHVEGECDVIAQNPGRTAARLSTAMRSRSAGRWSRVVRDTWKFPAGTTRMTQDFSYVVLGGKHPLRYHWHVAGHLPPGVQLTATCDLTVRR